MTVKRRVVDRLQRRYADLTALDLARELSELGWIRSRRGGEVVDGGGRPIPWMTYPFLAFIEPRLTRAFRVFEFGSGASTAWWAARASAVVSCEHDRVWHDRVRANLPPNVELLWRDLGDEYPAALRGRGSFDLIVIDGRMRNECAIESVSVLKPGGVVIWDNAEREEYRPGYEHLTDAGLRRLDFTGFGPVNDYRWTTAVFYGDENCLGI